MDEWRSLPVPAPGLVAHMRLLASRGAKVVVNDPGGSVDGTGGAAGGRGSGGRDDQGSGR